MNIDQTLEERGERYGDFRGHAEITQGIKNVMRVGENWGLLDDDQIEALDMIAHKIGRIVNGDPDYVDSWTDIIGYARLVEKRLIDEVQKPRKPSITEQLHEAAQKIREREKFCTDPACPEHNPAINNAIEVLLKAGVIRHADE